MLEAVNSVLSNAPATRGVAEQQANARTNVATSTRGAQETVAGRAPFVSPAIAIDRESSRAIIQIRDSDTGDVVRQFPTEGQLKAYRQAQEFSERQRAQADSQVREATGSSASSVSSDVSASAPQATADVSASAPTSIETEA